jgi:hypothetical protein
MQRSGQAEFYFIVGLIVIALVVVYSVLSASSSPSQTNAPISVQQQQNLVKNSVLKIIRDGADLSVKEISMRGGHFEPNAGNSVVFWNVLVPYWQKCSETSMPSKAAIKSTLESGIRNYLLNSGLPNLYQRVFFRTQELSVSATINENNVQVSVVLPTLVENYPIQQPYQLQIPTKLGRMIDFATDFVNGNKNERWFDWFTIGSLRQSTLPTEGILTNCGERIYVTQQQQKAAFMDIIKYTIANTFWWVPLQPANPGEPKTWAIERVGSKQYKDLDIDAYLPDGFDIDVGAPIVIRSNPHVINEPFGFAFRECFTPYQQLYSISYPLVLRVKDSLMDNFFQFAIYVDTANSGIGSCAGNPITDACKDLGCTANITVKNINNESVPGAIVDFANCTVGSTDNSGRLNAPVKCGQGDLLIFADGYEPLFINGTSSDAINSIYALSSYRQINFNLKKVRITTDSTGNVNCQQSDIGANEQVDVVFKSGSEQTMWTNMQPDLACTSQCFTSTTATDREKINCVTACPKTYSANISIELPMGDYEINATIKNAASGNYTGGVSTGYRISSSLDLNLLLLLLENESAAIDSQMLNILRGRLSNCGPGMSSAVAPASRS